MDQKKITKIASIVIGVILAIVLVIVGFRFVQKRFLQAGGDQATAVQVTDIADSEATISFNTASSVSCFVQYGPSSDEASHTFFAQDISETATHDISINLLSSATTYYFTIRCNNTKTDNNNQPFEFTTAAEGQSGSSTGAIPTVTAPTATIAPSPTAATVSVSADYCANENTMQQQASNDPNWGYVACVTDCANNTDINAATLCAKVLRPTDTP